MTTENTLDRSEDLETLEDVPLVQITDVQPVDRSLQESEEILETCVIDDSEYECVVEDEESNVGSIISVLSEEVVYVDDGTMEFIVPEVVDPPEYLEDPDPDQITQDEQTEDQSLTILKEEQDSWPTLEILPGGVINMADKNDLEITEDNDGYMEPSGMLYACAKCSQSFKYLFCLVKHVKTHTDEDKKQVDTPKSNQTNKYICLNPVQRKIKLKTKNVKDVIPLN